MTDFNLRTDRLSCQVRGLATSSILSRGSNPSKPWDLKEDIYEQSFISPSAVLRTVKGKDITVHLTYTLNKEDRKGFNEDVITDHLKKIFSGVNDVVVDLLDLCLDKCMRMSDSYTEIYASEYQAMKGLPISRMQSNQKNDFNRAISQLSRFNLTINNFPITQEKNTVLVKLSGPLFVVGGLSCGADFPESPRLYAWHIAFGSPMTKYLKFIRDGKCRIKNIEDELSQYFPNPPNIIFSSNPMSEITLKRLSKGLLVDMRRNPSCASDGRVRSISSLFNEFLLPIPSKVSQIALKERFEDIMECLSDNKVISQWIYLESKWCSIENFSPLNSFQEWFSTKIKFYPSKSYSTALNTLATAREAKLKKSRKASGEPVLLNLKEILKINNLNQNQLSEKLGVTRALISQIVSGKRRVSAKLAKAIQESGLKTRGDVNKS